MAQHSNYAQDRDLMMEAYGSVEGNVPKTASTSLPRGYVLTESHCDEEKITKVELGGKVFEIGSDDPNDDGIVIEIEKHANGYFITGGVYSEPEDYVTDPENPKEGYGYALTLDGQPMDEDDLEDGLGHEDNEHVPAEDSSCASHEDNEHATPAEDSSCASNEEEPSDEFFEMLDDVSMEVGSESYEAIVAGLQLKLGRKLTEREAEEAHQAAQEDELPEDAEGEHSPVQACTAAIDSIAKGDTVNGVVACTGAIDKLSATLQGDEKVAAYEDLRDYINGSLHGNDIAEDLQDYLKRGLGHSEDAEGHHHSGSDDGECDECGGDGCDVCNGSGEQDEEEVVSESYTSQYLLK